jgi:hypothetical protein
MMKLCLGMLVCLLARHTYNYKHQLFFCYRVAFKDQFRSSRIQRNYFPEAIYKISKLNTPMLHVTTILTIFLTPTIFKLLSSLTFCYI